MKTKIKFLAAALMMTGTMALAEVSTEQLVSDLQADGYTWIEVKRGPTQIKIEAIKGWTKVETIIDRETGAVLKTETENAGDDAGRIGVQVRERSEDFLREGSDDDDGNDDDDDHSGRDDDDDDDDDDKSGHDDDDDKDDHDDDDDKSGHGGDDDDDEDGDDD